MSLFSRVADGPVDTTRGIHDFRDDEDFCDENGPCGEFYEDSLKPAFQAFLDEVAGDDLPAFLTGMRTGESNPWLRASYLIR